MKYLRLVLFIANVTLFSLLVSAQIEVNPYLALAGGNQEIAVLSDDRQPRAYLGKRFSGGVDVLLGRRQLAPYFGILYRPNRYEGLEGGEFRDDRLLLPIGAAYRLLPASLTYNIVFTAALTPNFRLGSAKDPIPEDDSGLRWQARTGATLYIDMVTLGAHYYPFFGRDVLREEGKSSLFMFSLGGRF